MAKGSEGGGDVLLPIPVGCVSRRAGSMTSRLRQRPAGPAVVVGRRPGYSAPGRLGTQLDLHAMHHDLACCFRFGVEDSRMVLP